MFNGKNVVVTGGSRGIGAAIVEAFAKNGANVIFTYNSNEVTAYDIKNELEKKYPEQMFKPVQCDVSKNSSVNEFYENYLDNDESLDVLVNNAGITDDSLMIMLDSDKWEKVIQTNLTGAYYLTQKVSYKMLKQRNGSIVNISSVAGVYGNAGQCNYSAAKAGLIGMSKSLSKEMAPSNVRVNVVAPGFIATDMTDKLGESVRESIIDKIAIKRMGEAVDVANAVIFIASDNAKYITGQTIIVDGGLVI